MDKYGIILVFIFMAFIGLQIFNGKKYKPTWVNKIAGLFWIILGGGGGIIMVIKLLKW
tara:strand:+ start:213 stop:386 length:174 start_codon:yes stop_codon:yes gene_type:complete